MGFSPGLCRVSTDLNQLLHVIVGFGSQLYSVCRFFMHSISYCICAFYVNCVLYPWLLLLSLYLATSNAL